MILTLIVLAVLAAAPAPAPGPAGAVVTIQRAGDADPVLLAASQRMRSELAISGYAGQIVACAVDPVNGPVDCPPTDTLDSISLARAGDVTSIFAASVLPNGRRSWRRLRVADAEGGADPALIAVRAVELLRDVQVQLAAAAAADPEEPTPLEPFAQQPPRPPVPWRLLAGVSMLMAPWSTQSALFPVFGGSLGASTLLSPRASLLLQAAGPFICGLPIAADGAPAPSDRLLFQILGLASVRVGLRPSETGPFGALRAGGRYFNIRLNASNLKGSSDSAIIPVGGVGAGYAFRIPGSERLIASVEAHVDASNFVVQVVDVSGKNVLDQTGHLFWGLDLTTAIALP